MYNLERFRVKELDSCPRRLELKYKGEEELPPHFINVSGRIVHATTKDILEGKEPALDFHEFPEAEKELKVEIEKPMSNLKSWLAHPSIVEIKTNRKTKEKTITEKEVLDLDGATIEEELELDLGDGYVLVGHPDMITKDYIIDFKSGPKRNTKENRRQLVAYGELSIRLGLHAQDKPPRLFNVFLGHSQPEVLELTEKEKEAARIELWELIEKHKGIIALIKQGVKMPCKISFECVYCEFRGAKCRGV